MIGADMPGGRQHFAGWADINVAFFVEPEIFSRERSILALRFVDNWNVRLDLLLIDDRSIGGEIHGLDVETRLRPLIIVLAALTS
jgi:hypothetical protein